MFAGARQLCEAPVSLILPRAPRQGRDLPPRRGTARPGPSPFRPACRRHTSGRRREAARRGEGLTRPGPRSDARRSSDIARRVAEGQPAPRTARPRLGEPAPASEGIDRSPSSRANAPTRNPPGRDPAGSSADRSGRQFPVARPNTLAGAVSAATIACAPGTRTGTSNHALSWRVTSTVESATARDLRRAHARRATHGRDLHQFFRANAMRPLGHFRTRIQPRRSRRARSRRVSTAGRQCRTE